MISGLMTRWRRVSDGDVDVVVERLATWPCAPGGEVRHMFALETIRERGPSVVRVASNREGWAAAIVLPRQVVVPCGDAPVIADAGIPNRTWRLVVGDAAAADALLHRWGAHEPNLVVHAQRFMVVDPAQVPPAADLPDPGLRRARPADVDGLAELAVELHVEDGYGGDPGRAGRRAYRRRMERAIQRGSVWTVGEVGSPLVKIERAVDSDRYGVQLSGIVVREEERRHGLGRAAVATAVRGALAERGGPVALHVRADNEVALRAYRAAGFVDAEEWRLAVRG
ncbi:MAG: GNAT family N-acetyltransferase [Nitriliruptorales bacterium]